MQLLVSVMTYQRGYIGVALVPLTVGAFYSLIHGLFNPVFAVAIMATSLVTVDATSGYCGGSVKKSK